MIIVSNCKSIECLVCFSLEEISDKLSSIEPLRLRLGRLREENVKHRQYAAAMDNLKHLFNVPVTIQRTFELISEGKLLMAHMK